MDKKNIPQSIQNSSHQILIKISISQYQKDLECKLNSEK
jgi:hypothetical protein